MYFTHYKKKVASLINDLSKTNNDVAEALIYYKDEAKKKRGEDAIMKEDAINKVDRNKEIEERKADIRKRSGVHEIKG